MTSVRRSPTLGVCTPSAVTAQGKPGTKGKHGVSAAIRRDGGRVARPITWDGGRHPVTEATL